jgi:uncharacterized membrane protein YesL
MASNSLPDYTWTDKIGISMQSFIKATMICGMLSFLVYTFPILGQITVIGILGFLWSASALQVVRHVRRRWLA